MIKIFRDFHRDKSANTSDRAFSFKRKVLDRPVKPFWTEYKPFSEYLGSEHVYLPPRVWNGIIDYESLVKIDPSRGTFIAVPISASVQVPKIQMPSAPPDPRPDEDSCDLEDGLVVR